MDWKKFGSRKFLMTLVTVIISVMALFGIDEGTIQLVSLIAGIIIPTLSYVIVEGVIDVKRILMTAVEVVDALDGEDEASA